MDNRFIADASSLLPEAKADKELHELNNWLTEAEHLQQKVRDYPSSRSAVIQALLNPGFRLAIKSLVPPNIKAIGDQPNVRSLVGKPCGPGQSAERSGCIPMKEELAAEKQGMTPKPPIEQQETQPESEAQSVVGDVLEDPNHPRVRLEGELEDHAFGELPAIQTLMGELTPQEHTEMSLWHESVAERIRETGGDEGQALAHEAAAHYHNSKVIQAVTLERAKAEYGSFKDKYLKEKGNGKYDEEGNLESVYLSADDWRDLFLEYNGPNAHEVQQAAVYLNDRLFNESLEALKGKGNNRVIITAGGGGSGKSTAVARRLNGAGYPIILDKTGSNPGHLLEDYDKIEGAGFGKDYIFVDRNPKEAYSQGVVKRALALQAKGEKPRTVPLTRTIHSNVSARKSAIDILQNHPEIDSQIVDNNHGAGQSRDIVDRQEAIHYLEEQKHDEAKLTEELTDETFRLYERGEISRSIAAGLIGQSTIDSRELASRRRMQNEE